jgi:hypothetical protein
VAAAIIQVVQGFWFQVKETDNRAVLVPWAAEHLGEHPLVTKMADFLMALMTFRKYFPRAQPRSEGLTLYTSILMAHDVSFEDMTENIGWWMKERNFGLWRRSIQAEVVKQDSGISLVLYENDERWTWSICRIFSRR